MFSPPLTTEDQSLLLDIAERSISHGLKHRRAFEPLDDDFPPHLRVHGCAFVTLRIETKLRGCMGSMVASRPIVADVAMNAYSAAFRDPRFSPLIDEEYARLSIGVSLLETPRPVAVSSEEELLRLMSERDAGWIIHCGEKRGLLLPAVWKSLPDPAEFLATLKTKAGLDREIWSDNLKFECFGATSFGREAVALELRGEG